MFKLTPYNFRGVGSMNGGTLTNDLNIIGLDISELEKLDNDDLLELLNENKSLLDEIGDKKLTDESEYDKKQLINETKLIEELLEHTKYNEDKADEYRKRKIFQGIKEGTRNVNIEDILIDKKVKKGISDYDFGKAYEDYTKINKDKQRYKKIDPEFNSIEYDDFKYALYDAKLKNGKTIEDKNYYVFKYPKGYRPEYEDGTKIKPQQMNYKYLSSNYDEEKDKLTTLKELYNTSYEPDEIEEIENEIKKLTDGIGIPIQLSKFKGSDKNGIPLFEINDDGTYKLYGIYDKKKDFIDERNNDIDVKINLKNGEYIYELTKDKDLEPKYYDIINGKKYYTLYPKSYYIDSKNKTNWVYLPKSKLKKI
jgi:hypothetical protein